jgi:hypothetical protein
MTTFDVRHRASVSRRVLVFGAALAAGAGAGLAPAPAVAQTKVSQKLVSYQATPKGAARCDNCLQWQAPSSCKLVQGAIAASGWCSLYGLNPKHGTAE